MKRAIFFGTPEIAARLLRAATMWPQIEIVLVVTEPAKPAGRGRRLSDSPVKLAAQELKIPVCEPTSRAELLAAVESVPAELGMLLAYGRILPTGVLNHFEYGVLNLHPSLLPLYRGPAPVFWPLLNGDAETGVTIIQLDDGCDTGPLLARQAESIRPDDTTETLTDRLVDQGVNLLANCLPDYLEGLISPQAQVGEPSLTRKLTADDGLIDWRQAPDQIERQIRACRPWPRARAVWRGAPLLILEARVDNQRLVPTLVQPAGRRAMSWADFCRGQHLDEATARDELTRLA